MTTTKADELAAELEADGFSPKAHYGAAAELRRLSAVEAERDELKLAFAHAVRLVQDWKQSVYTTEAERDALLAARTSPAHGWTDADADAARLALELECILTDGDTPMAVTSRWWESAHEALALHRQRISDELREIECPPDPDAVDRALDADALRADAERWRFALTQPYEFWKRIGFMGCAEDQNEAIDAAMKGAT